MAAGYLLLAGFELWNKFEQGKLIDRASNLAREEALMNAEFAELDAYEAERAGYSIAAREQSVAQQSISELRADYASKEVDVGYGTAADIQAESWLIGYLNTIDLRRAARDQAKGFLNEAGSYRLGANAIDAQGRINKFATQISGVARAGEITLRSLPASAPKTQKSSIAGYDIED